MSKNIQINLPKVRMIFPSLFELDKFGRYSATLLLSKETHAKQIEEINKATEELKKHLKIKKLSKEIMLCCDDELDNIDDSDEKGALKKKALAYKAGNYSLQASTNSKFLPVLRKRAGGDNLDITKDENPFYPGCHVNAIIQLAPHDGKYGKLISKYLCMVQLSAKEGDRLYTNSSPVNVDGVFEDDVEDGADDFNSEDLF